MCLTPKIWSFDEIAKSSSDRAALLESAPRFEILADTIADVLSAALMNGHVRLALEEAERDAAEVRAVIQFAVDEALFDQFFNSRTGYRASFRSGFQKGMELNASTIRKIRKRLERGLDSKITVARLDSSFEFKRTEEIARDAFLDSLDPYLSKVWMCGKLVQMSGSVDILPLGLTGPRILLNQDCSWPAPCPTDAWIDVKGAFLGRDGPYQPKDPEARARALAATGEPG